MKEKSKKGFRKVGQNVEFDGLVRYNWGGKKVFENKNKKYLITTM